jgi:hypothetical protein
MDRMVLGVVVVLGHPAILLSCLIGVVLFLSWPGFWVVERCLDCPMAA